FFDSPCAPLFCLHPGSDALLVVIGRQWAARSEHGYGSRLFEPTDWVRTEIEAAFAGDKQVVPVLVGEASMPAPDELPESIRHLVRLQAAFVSDRRWDSDLDDLTGRLRLLCPELAPAAPPAREDEVSPGAALREIGERVFDEIASRRRAREASPGLFAQFLNRLLQPIGRGFRKLLGTILVIGVLYAGLRLFGDADTLRMLDKMQARLLVGWVRLQAFLAQVTTWRH
ncbi:MAG: hypothetical protein ABI478_03120, partial [Propionivibrio sp.]